jgi:hypothetical protein
MTSFEAAAVAAVGVLGPDGLRRLAASVEAGRPVDRLSPEAESIARRVLDAVAGSTEAAAAYLRGVAAGYEHRAARVQAELVWTGPSVFDVPVRALTTYSARPYVPLLAALRGAVDRGVIVWIVVDTLHGAGSAMQGEQPAKAFADPTRRRAVEQREPHDVWLRKQHRGRHPLCVAAASRAGPPNTLGRCVATVT